MKYTKSILMAAAAALSIASASAQSVIYITGATAFRTAANKNLYAMFGDKLFATDASSATNEKANGLYFTNCELTGGAVVDIAVTWTGSEGGMQQVASGNNDKRVPYFDKNKILVAGKTTAASRFSLTKPDTTGFQIGPFTTLQKGHIGFSDSFQNSSRWRGGFKGEDGLTYNSLAMEAVGIVPYSYMASKGFTNSFPERTITTDLAQQALETGLLTGNLLTGNENDADIKIWSLGRNIESGSRVINHAVNKYGVDTPVIQWAATSASGNINTLKLHPAANLLGVGIAEGNNGESSGSTLGGLMTNTVNLAGPATKQDGTALLDAGSTNYVIGYSSVGDSVAYIKDGMTYLKYNGVEGRCYSQTNITTLDAGYTNIITGKYPYWGYEFVTWDAGLTANTNTPVLAEMLYTRIRSLSSTDPDLAPNISVNDMKVGRSQDGGKSQLE
jgi:hypothetical protein